MPKTLVIVESPAKAKTISKYLGSEYVVKSSVGHIRDLPKGKSKSPSKRNLIPKDLPIVLSRSLLVTKSCFFSNIFLFGFNPNIS